MNNERPLEHGGGGGGFGPGGGGSPYVIDTARNAFGITGGNDNNFAFPSANGYASIAFVAAAEPSNLGTPKPANAGTDNPEAHSRLHARRPVKSSG
jgi:hypothetical protein